MTDTEILEKYGHIELVFEKYYNSYFTYKSLDEKYKVIGVIDTNSELHNEMTVNELSSELLSYKFTKT